MTTHLFPELSDFAADEGLLLYPALVPRPLGYVERIMADGRITPGELFTELFPPDQPQPPDPVGALEVGEGGIEARIYSGAAQGSVIWGDPLVVAATYWPYDDRPGTEVSLSLRQRGAPISEPWVRVRTVWPSGALETGQLTRQQVYALYLKPRDFRRLWRLLDAALRLHSASAHLPAPFTDVDDKELEALSSQSPSLSCVACGSAAVALLAPDAYHCYACGYEGGQGYEQHRANMHRQAFTVLPREVRLRMALDDLDGALEDMGLALHFGWTIRTGEEGPMANDVAEVGHATRFCAAAFQQLENASLKLPEFEEEFSGLLALRARCIPEQLGEEVVKQIMELSGVLRRA